MRLRLMGGILLSLLISFEISLSHFPGAVRLAYYMLQPLTHYSDPSIVAPPASMHIIYPVILSQTYPTPMAKRNGLMAYSSSVVPRYTTST